MKRYATSLKNLADRTGIMSRLGLFVGLALLLAACGGVQPSDSPAPGTTDTAADAATPIPAEENDSGDVIEIAPADNAGELPAGDRPLATLEPEARNGYFTEAPDLTIDPAANYYATIATEKGDIVVQLFADRAPVTVNNFVFLANQGFYDNTTFHRVLDGFMAQAGDPTGTGTGGPGYQFQDEFTPGLTFDRPGLLAMANGGPSTNGSQFFITFAPTEWLDGYHTIFGEVISGNEVLAQLTRRDPTQNPTEPGDVITSITIETRPESVLPTPTPLPPTPTPYAPTSLEGDRPLAELAPEERNAYFNAPPEMVIDAAADYRAILTTSKGDIELTLNAEEAPIAVNNFVVLVNLGFYDGLSITAIPGQALVFGSLTEDQASDVGYTFAPETGFEPTRGSLAYVVLQPMPNEPPVSSGSQLLIALTDPPVETAQFYSFFGTVTDGDDVLDELTSDDIIESVTIVEE